MFNKIRLWLKWDAKHLHRDIIQGIKNLVKWFPIVWKDRDWDTHYIWQVMKFKLKNQSKYIGYHDRHLSAKRDAQIMMLCVKLIEKIQSEYYGCEYLDYQESKFYFTPIPNSDKSEMKSEILSQRFNEYFAKYPRIYKQVMQMKNPIFKRNDDYGIAMNISHINHQRALKLLFKIMETNIERWWD